MLSTSSFGDGLFGRRLEGRLLHASERFFIAGTWPAPLRRLREAPAHSAFSKLQCSARPAADKAGAREQRESSHGRQHQVLRGNGPQPPCAAQASGRRLDGIRDDVLRREAPQGARPAGCSRQSQHQRGGGARARSAAREGRHDARPEAGRSAGFSRRDRRLHRRGRRARYGQARPDDGVSSRHGLRARARVGRRVACADEARLCVRASGLHARLRARRAHGRGTRGGALAG